MEKFKKEKPDPSLVLKKIMADLEETANKKLRTNDPHRKHWSSGKPISEKPRTAEEVISDVERRAKEEGFGD